MSNHEYDIDHINDRPSLVLGERIVWISDNGPEYGNVRWLGKLPDLGREWMAGVEFDNPVGSGTGLYKDRQLFVTPLNHASLVPVIGLLKASDFDGPVDQGSQVRKCPPLLESSYNAIKDDYLYQLCEKIDDFKPANRISPQKNKPKVRHIPIKLERDETTSSHRSPPPIPTTKKPELPRKPFSIMDKSPFERNRPSKDSLDRLTTLMKHVDIDGRQSYSQDLSLLPSPPLQIVDGDKNPALALKSFTGKSKGIQGHNNSCYLDATLFAMFSSTTLFDSLLYRPPNSNDIPEYCEIQKILRENIVRPLREDFIVSAEQVMSFRTMLEKSSSVEGLTDEEKDPEEFLSLLLGQMLKAEHYLKLSSGLESFLHQLIVEKDENVVLPTVQDLFEQSFAINTVRLREIPPCLLLQMPRFGRQYKMYSRIMPSLKLDITDVLESAPRACGHRGKDCDNIAKYECRDCLREGSATHSARLSSITFCQNCFQSKHFGKAHLTGIENHDKTKTLLSSIPKEAMARYSNRLSGVKDKQIPRICMDLFAILCIETSHYVCFVKCGQESDSPWCFFDSMADRKGEVNGYNIPEVLLFEEFAFWTSENGVSYLVNHKDDKLLPEMAKRLICDAYLCFYRYNGLASYR